MKKIFTLIFLALILFQSTKNIWVLTSFYLQQDYIAANLCEKRYEKIPLCKGQCVLTKELQKKNRDEQKLPHVKQNEIQLFCGSLTIYHLSRSNPGFKENLQFHYQVITACGISTSVFHPPNFS